MIDSYLAHLTLTGARPKTIRVRREQLHAWQRWLAPLSIGDATRQHVEMWLSRPLAPASRRAYRSALRGLYGWAVENELLHADPTVKVPSIRVPRGVPRPVCGEDLSRALDGAAPRMRAWLLLMALAGLRCCEVAPLEPRDVIDTPVGPILYLRVTKGGAPATVPCHPLVIEALAVLPIRSGTWWQVQPDTVSQTVSTYLRSRGIRGTAHSLRHTAATAWLHASGHDLLTTATLMRHVNVNTTTIYAGLSPERPAEVARSVSLRSVG